MPNGRDSRASQPKYIWNKARLHTKQSTQVPDIIDHSCRDEVILYYPKVS